MNILAGFCLAELLGMFFIFFNLLLPGALFFTSKSKLATSCRFDGRRRCTSKIRAGRVFVLFSSVSKGQRPRRGKKTQFQNNSTTTTTRAQRKNKNKKLANKTIEKRKKNKTRPGREKSPRRKHALWTGREKEKRAKKNPSPNFFVHETRRNWPHSAENGIAAMAGSRSPEVAHPECTARNRKNLCKNNNRSRTTQHTFRLLAPPFPDSGRRQTSFKAGQSCQPASSKITQQTSSTPAAVTVLKQCQAVPQGWDWVSSQH